MRPDGPNLSVKHPQLLVPVGSWNHSSAIGGSLPVGNASVRVVDDHAVASIRYLLDSEDGRRAFDVFRRLGAAARWSCPLLIQVQTRRLHQPEAG